MQKKSSIIPINEKMMEIKIFTTMMMMMVMMIVIMIKMMITMTMTISILHIIYCIAFRLLTSKLINTSITRVKISFFTHSIKKCGNLVIHALSRISYVDQNAAAPPLPQQPPPKSWGHDLTDIEKFC